MGVCVAKRGPSSHPLMAVAKPDGKGVLLYDGIMVSRSHQIDGLLDALGDKGATIVRTRLLAHRLFDKGLINQAIRDELLESLQTDALNQALARGAEQAASGQGAVVTR